VPQLSLQNIPVWRFERGFLLVFDFVLFCVNSVNKRLRQLIHELLDYRLYISKSAYVFLGSGYDKLIEVLNVIVTQARVSAQVDSE
jgi:hypothetical protein